MTHRVRLATSILLDNILEVDLRKPLLLYPDEHDLRFDTGRTRGGLRAPGAPIPRRQKFCGGQISIVGVDSPCLCRLSSTDPKTRRAQTAIEYAMWHPPYIGQI